MPVGVVLAGGRSRRMGTDKSLLPVAGVPMVQRVATAMAAAGCDPVWCQGGDIEALARLGLSVHPDPAGGQGPLAAILAALRRTCSEPLAADDLVVIGACDLPGAGAATVGRLLAVAGERPEAAVVVAADPAGATHMLAVWRRSAVEPLAQLVAGGCQSYRCAVAELGAVPVEVGSRPLRNVNTPAEVINAERDLAPVASPSMAVSEIDVGQLADALAAGGRLVDVREPGEFAAARVPGAVLVPLATVPENVQAFQGDGPVYVICRSGARSMRACEFLAEVGVTAVNVAGGTMAWVASGRAFDSGDA